MTPQHNPYLIIESGLDDIDDDSVYDNNFKDMFETNDISNPAPDGKYNYYIFFNFASIPQKFKKDFKTFVDYMKIFDTYLRELFVYNMTIVKNFGNLQYYFGGVGWTFFRNFETKEYQMTNPILKKTDHLFIDNMSFNTDDMSELTNIAVAVPCNLRPNYSLINKLIKTTFINIPKFCQKNMNHGAKFLQISSLCIYSKSENEYETMSYTTYRNNTESSIKTTIRKIQKLVVGEPNNEYVNKFLNQKTYLDYIKSYVESRDGKPIASLMTVEDTPDAYIIHINNKSYTFSSYYDFSKDDIKEMYENLCKTVGKPVLYDFSNCRFCYESRPQFRNLHYFLELTTKNFPKMIINIYEMTDDALVRWPGNDYDLNIPINLAHCHIDELTITYKKPKFKDAIKFINDENVLSIKYAQKK